MPDPFLNALRQYRLLEPKQLDELTGKLQARDLPLHTLAQILGLGSDQTELTFSRFSITELSGPGEILRLEEPAAKNAITERPRP